MKRLLSVILSLSLLLALTGCIAEEISLFYDETAEAWKHAKEVAFQMYQQLRYFCDEGIPKYSDCFHYSSDLKIKRGL